MRRWFKLILVVLIAVFVAVFLQLRADYEHAKQAAIIDLETHAMIILTQTAIAGD